MIPVHAADSSIDNTAGDVVVEDVTGEDISDGTTTDNETPEEPDEPVIPDEPVMPDESEDPDELVPIHLEGSMYKKKRAVLTWNSEDSEAAYEVYRSTSKNSGFKLVKTLKNQTGASTFHDSILTLGNTYYYKVNLVPL
jgi:hypothetical protein